MNEEAALIRQRMRTPRAAAIAGIIFSVLLITSILLIRLSVPADPFEPGVWLKTSLHTVALALNMVPFAGIAFLWFIAVLRDRLGELEDRFFATVFLGSALLFLAMLFVSAAVTSGFILAYSVQSKGLLDTATFTFARAVSYGIMNIYAIKMAAVFMISLGTIWVRTRVMPRWLALLTYALALGLLLSIGSSLWVTLIFPAWVCAVSVYILVLNPRSPSASLQGGLE